MLKENVLQKTLNISLAAVVAISILSGCSGSSQPASNNVKSVESQTKTSTEDLAKKKAEEEVVQTQVEKAPVVAETKSEVVSNLIPAKVVRVVDGDTMEVSYDGKQETIRLLLVDTPETKHPDKPVQPFGPEASSFAKKTLEDKDVKLEIDVSERDKYGRLLCYLWVGDKMFNEMLLEKGLARVAYVIPPNVKYVDQYRETQKKAQQSGIGIWSIENYVHADHDHGFHDEVVAAKEQQPIETQPAPEPQPKPEPKPQPTQQSVYYKNCSEVRAAGAAPIYAGEPGYSRKLDRDGDGVACE
ncbi:thermonuclease family protein [Robertmurraya sp.]|uniref:thermonuclease family protein n=1 Tax=Robertmurraya sp. TaxID=2837525 RepID=UPI0037047DE5